MTGPLSSLLCCKARGRTGSFLEEGHATSSIKARPALEVAHSILKDHNLPYGLMPMGSLLSCEFSEATGKLIAIQPDTECECEFGGHWIKFENHISGIISKNAVRDLKGVKVKCCFVWLPIKSIDVEAQPGAKIHFHVGPFSTSIPVQELWDYKFWPHAFRPAREEEAKPLPAELAIKALLILSPRGLRRGVTPEGMTPA